MSTTRKRTRSSGAQGGRPISEQGGRSAPLVLRLRPGLVALLRAVAQLGHEQTELVARGLERELAAIVRRLDAKRRAELGEAAEGELVRVLKAARKRAITRTEAHDDEARADLASLLGL